MESHNGDGVWRLYNITINPGETDDLSESQSSKFAELIVDYDNYTIEYGVLEMGITTNHLMKSKTKLESYL